MEVKQGEQLRREQVHKNEEATKRVSELEGKLQESERDRQRLRHDKDSLQIQIQDAADVMREKAKQEEIVQILKRSQEALEAAN
jgi:tRNA threonylcarbamoyladenosine modification (KEOPS) complex  Pcc1 subunit